MRLLPGVEEIWGAVASSPLISASVQSFIVVVVTPRKKGKYISPSSKCAEVL